ncbi:MAG: hypothetical protein FJ015_00040 [Chloroflexi bacterium]|nr:hypothetical protein [Chloroflexota bacterium]
MFKLSGRKREAKATENKKRGESQGGGVVQDRGDTEQLVETVNGIIDQRGVSVSASVRSILKAAISSAEQIIDSVRTQAVAEAQQAADRIIAEAKKGAGKIESQNGPVPEETAEVMAASAGPVAAETGEEPVPEPLESQVAEPVAAEAVSLPEDPAIVEPTAAVMEPRKAGKKRGTVTGETPEVVLTKEESLSPYTGEVDINVEVPIEPTLVAKLYNFLQTTPEVKFVRTVGSWNKGSTITVMMEKPVPLLAMLVAKLPEANISPGRPEVKDYVGSRRGVRRITVSARNQ